MEANVPQEGSVWVVDDDRSIRWVLDRALSGAGFTTRCFDSAENMLNAFMRESPETVVTDIRMPGMDGLKLMEAIHDKVPEMPVIVMTAHADLDRAVAAYQNGAFEYLPKPFDVDDAVSIVRRALAAVAPSTLPDATEQDEGVPEIIGSAPAMQEVFRAIGRLSQSNMTVLITGESGTGKELVAQALHRHSPRAGRPFIALNTAAIPRDLLESELFGHEKGAFTGATAQRVGRFEQANTGTLFLDEIGDMPAELQTRLLRVLADGEFYRVGGHEPIRVDVRVIAATHQKLLDRVESGQFREDLFHRLNVIRIELPALRQRASDIRKLAEFFLANTAREVGGEIKQLSPEVLRVLERYQWPGNVRELENLCRRLTIMAPTREVHVDDLPEDIRAGAHGIVEAGGGDWQSSLKRWAEQHLIDEGAPPLLDEAMPVFERIMIRAALRHTHGRRQEAARKLGWGRNTLTRKIKDLSLDD